VEQAPGQSIPLFSSCSTWNNCADVYTIGTLFHVEQLPTRNPSKARAMAIIPTPIVPRGTSPEVADSVLPGLV
jgi:hypothetical protein